MDFLEALADQLAALPDVEAVTLGGSRAQGTARPDSDWDLGIYYRKSLDVRTLRSLGHEGQVSEVGGWGGGVFNGGCWWRVAGEPVDVHYRDLDVVESEVRRAGQGKFDIEPLMFHLAGIPTYLVVAELASNRTLRGGLPRVDAYPPRLREAAVSVWSGRARLTLGYAEKNSTRTAQALGLISLAVTQYAHAVAASRGIWVTNEKRLLDVAGLRGVDELFSTEHDPAELVHRIRTLAEIREVEGIAALDGITARA
ncbi:nucleotidyltransferase domain-containing protein [Kineosporia succinea]|uniref:Nucleotidyltransferase n=1 Tax=Kineosporia succinea TaxID=84632 RepID=A0ABT9P5E7_9ACTN|nr:nucleotidyltransferase domain-containing protein [Kineosporia succinea]MDP9827917.1 putative nucleotidyltransferase [Kineosporia succinea]